MPLPIPEAARDASSSSSQSQTFITADADNFDLAASASVAANTDAASGEAPRPTGVQLRKLLSYYRPHRAVLAADLACAVIVAATALLLPLCANIVAGRLAVAEGAPATADVLRTVALTGGTMLLLVALQAVATFFVDYQGHMMGARIEATLRRELFEHAQRLDFGFHDRIRVGQLMSRITNDSFDIGELYHHGPEDLAIAVLKVVGVLAILAWLDGFLTLLIIAMLPLFLWHTLHYSARMNHATRVGAERIAGINERVEDALAGVRVVQSFGREALEDQRFEVENDRFLQSRRAIYRAEAHLSLGLENFPQLLTVLVIVAGAWRIAQARMEVADLLTFLLCVAVLLDPAKRAANLVRLWQAGFTGFVRIMEVLEVEPAVRDRPGAIELARTRGAVTFDRVGFRYEENGPPVLRDLCLAIEPGETVALVGASGAGKTTLCALIPRFYEVNEGRVLIDGHDVQDLSLASLRRSVGVVQQDVYLFAGTVFENIRYGRLDATDAEIVAAAVAAGAHDFIAALPKGYNTDIGQRGVKLSGGQRQRLTIARAFLKDPAILILDEATSALDAVSERLVQEALALLARDRTTIVIAHRLSTVRDADRILVLTDKGVAEEGTHHELMAQGGSYASLYKVQADI